MSRLLQRHGKATILHVEGVQGVGLLNDRWPAGWRAGEFGLWVTGWSSGIDGQEGRKVVGR